jgi:hypothetical protein
MIAARAPRIRAKETSSPFIISGGSVFSDCAESTEIQAHSLNDGKRTSLAKAEMMMPSIDIRSVSGGYVYFSERIDREDKQASYVVRVPVEGGDPERLYSQQTTGSGIIAVDGYVYWEEVGRLVRKPL